MIVRRLEQSEHGLTRALYEEVFSEDSQSFVDYYYTEKTKDNQIYVVEEDGKIQSMLHLNPYELNVNGTKKTAHYIVAVATRETYRGRGFMKALLEKALRDMNQEGESFTYLMPAAEAIYTPHGFRTVYEQQLEYCPIGEKGEVRLDNGVVCDVKPAEKEDLPVLAEAENGALAAEGYQVYTIKSTAYYERLVREYASENAKLMIYYLNDRIVGSCPYVPEQEEEEAPKIMVRITDVKRLLSAVSLKELTVVCFQITDPIIEANNRCVVVTGTEYSGVMLMDGVPENSEGTVTVEALAELLFGVKSVEEVCAEEGVSMSPRMQGEMKKLVPLSKIRLDEEV